MAIAFVRAAAGGFTIGSTHTFAFDCTSADCLFVTVFGGTGAFDITGVTYNGVSMGSDINRILDFNDRWTATYILTNPSSGSNNVVISTSGTVCGGNAACYSGATGGVDVSATNGTSSPDTSLTVSATSTANNDWFMLGVKDSVGGTSGQTAGTGSTLRVYDTTSGLGMFDSNAAQSAGSYSMSVTAAFSRQLAGVMVAFKETSVSAIYSLMGQAVL